MAATLPSPRTVSAKSLLTTAGGWHMRGKSTWQDNVGFVDPGAVAPGTQAKVEAIDWFNVNAGPINIDLGRANAALRYHATMGHSMVYATAHMDKEDFNFLGIRVTTNRLLVAHSQVPLLIALAFADLIVPLTIALVAGYLISQAGGIESLLADISKFFGVVIHESITPITNTLIWTTLFTVAGTGLIYLIVYKGGSGAERPRPPGAPPLPAMPEPPKIALEAGTPRYRLGPLTTPGVAVGTGRTPSIPQPTEITVPRLGEGEGARPREHIRERLMERALAEAGSRRQRRRR